MKINKYIPLITIAIIIIIAAFLRLYRIGDYMAFLGDEGRDALVVKRMIVDREFTLLGPITSIGLMHLGPMYYYFMVPFLWLWNFNPVGPAVMVALFSLATVILIWKICIDYFDKRAAVVAALLYGLSPLVIAYSHSSWNPNILPFWGLLLIWGLLKVFASQKPHYFLVTGIALGVAIQLHYIALVYIPLIVVLSLLLGRKIPIKFYAYGVLGFLTTYAPFIIFEFRHEFINSKTILEFVTRTGGGKTFGYAQPLALFWDLTVRLFWRLIIVINPDVAKVFLLGIFGSTLILLRKWASSTRGIALTILMSWFIVGIGLLAFYTGNIYDYYLMFVFPLPFLLSGVVFSHFSRLRFGHIVYIVLVVVICVWQIQVTAILKEPNRLAAQAKEIADFIVDKTQDQPFNFALIAGGNSDHGYRYFMEISGHRPQVIENEAVDPKRTSVTDQLFVVCEEKICEPRGHSLWEIAGFGRAEITDEWKVGLFKVFRLVHYVGI